MTGQKRLSDHQITVDKDDHIALSVIYSAITTFSRTTVLLFHQTNMGETINVPTQPCGDVIGGAVVDDNHLVLIKSIR